MPWSKPVWLDATLSNGRYCMVGVSCRSQKDYDDRGFEVRRYSADLWINIYVSYEQCQKRMENAKRFVP